MPPPTLALATFAALATAAPAAGPHAHRDAPALAAPDFSAVPVGGHASLEGQFRIHRRAERRRRARTRRPVGRELDPASAAVLRRIAECESHGNPRSVGGGGAYRGAYQFTTQAWSSVGGRGDPAAAPIAEQTWRAGRLLARSGRSQWPVCGR